MKKILALTSIRSDYDLMSSLYKLLDNDPEIELAFIVSGAHLSPTYGLSAELIVKDGFKILQSIETLIDSNSKQARLKTASLFLQNSIDLIAQYAPDLILFAGDREDVIMGALLGGFLEIPTIHFYGGDHVQDGHIDNPVRHASSKLATAHMVSLEEHRQRLLKMGELESRIFVIGSIALDRFKSHQPTPKNELLEKLGVGEQFENFATLIFHPVAEEKEICHQIFEGILQELKKAGISTFVSTPNTDPGNRNLLNSIDRYRDDKNFFFYKNLDRDTFLDIYKNSRFLIGNSSSGILESASVPLPVINVGLRQTGRKANGNVIFCGTERTDIAMAIQSATSSSFQQSTKNIQNIYGDGLSANRAYRLIKNTNWLQMLRKKEDPLAMDGRF